MPPSSSHDSHGPAWLVQAADIARRFYLEGESKVAISDGLGLSRFKVARILDEARELGLVKVQVHLPAFIDADMSAAVAAHTGVPTIALSPDADGNSVRVELGRLGADLLAEKVSDDDVLGLSCSRTVTAACGALTALPTCEVVQLTGTLAGEDRDSGSVECVRAAAALGGGTAHPVYAPMVLPDEATVRGLSQQASIRKVLDRFPRVSIAMVSIGGWSEDTSTVWSSATAEERKDSLEGGTVGEIGGRLFDASGTAVRTSLDQRILGVDLDRLRDIGEVIALVYGAARAPAAHGALLGGLVDTLVCDHELARALLDLPPTSEAS